MIVRILEIVTKDILAKIVAVFTIGGGSVITASAITGRVDEIASVKHQFATTLLKIQR